MSLSNLSNFPMSDLRNVNLRQPKFSDRPYFLVWDTPTPDQLDQLAHQENAQQINYRENLLSRLPPDHNYLNLHNYIDREINTLKTLCATTTNPLILLEQFDLFITYLTSTPKSSISLFWEQFLQLRQLACPLWVILPQTLVPPQWPDWQKQSLNPPYS